MRRPSERAAKVHSATSSLLIRPLTRNDKLAISTARRPKVLLRLAATRQCGVRFCYPAGIGARSRCLRPASATSGFPAVERPSKPRAGWQELRPAQCSVRRSPALARFGPRAVFIHVPWQAKCFGFGEGCAELRQFLSGQEAFAPTLFPTGCTLGACRIVIFRDEAVAFSPAKRRSKARLTSCSPERRLSRTKPLRRAPRRRRRYRMAVDFQGASRRSFQKAPVFLLCALFARILDVGKLNRRRALEGSAPCDPLTYCQPGRRRDEPWPICGVLRFPA